MTIPTENEPVTNLDTVEAACRILRTFFNIAKAWRLTSHEQTLLLGVSEDTSNLWRSGQVAAPLPAGILERLGYVLDIYTALQDLLPIQERADAWVRHANTADLFGGEPAITLMLSGDIDNLRAVAAYLCAQTTHAGA